MLKAIFWFLILNFVLLIGVAAIFGFIPGLSSLIGAAPKDFGYRITQEDSQAAQNKIGTEIFAADINTPANQGFKLEGKQNAEFTLDSKELTALNNNRLWKNYPLKNVQTRINPDGTVESSGILIISKAMPYAENLGYSEDQIKEAMAKYNLPSVEVPYYLKGTGSVENDSVNISVSSLKIGAISVPQNIVDSAQKGAKLVIEDLIQRNSASFHCQSLRFVDGKMIFKGEVAQRQYVLED